MIDRTNDLDRILDLNEQAARSLLQQAIACRSVSGNELPLVRLVENWASKSGFETDHWETDESALSKYPQVKLRHLPLKGRPTLVVRLPGNGTGRSLIFNAHADVVAAPDPDKWRYDPWSGTECDGRIYGRGACDIKGSLVSALSAMSALRLAYPQGLPGDVLLELIPGEEDCVGLGTLTSVVRGYQSDAVIVLEPTESLPRPASRGACRFDITLLGRSVHGTVKWLGDDAIKTGRKVLDQLERMEAKFNDRSADGLFADYPIARPITVDTVHAGQWQGMIADQATIGGYCELLPQDDITDWKKRFTDELSSCVAPSKMRVVFSEEYAGHRTDLNHPICQLARSIVEPLRWTTWTAFNSGCEAGLRAGLLGTPTLVWGPGSLAQAHAVDEFVDWQQVQLCARHFARFAAQWSQTPR